MLNHRSSSKIATRDVILHMSNDDIPRNVERTLNKRHEMNAPLVVDAALSQDSSY